MDTPVAPLEGLGFVPAAHKRGHCTRVPLTPEPAQLLRRTLSFRAGIWHFTLSVVLLGLHLPPWGQRKTGAPIRVISFPKQGSTTGEMSQALQVLTKVIEGGQSDLLKIPMATDRQHECFHPHYMHWVK